MSGLSACLGTPVAASIAAQRSAGIRLRAYHPKIEGGLMPRARANAEGPWEISMARSSAFMSMAHMLAHS